MKDNTPLNVLELDLLKWVLYKEYEEKHPYPKTYDLCLCVEWHRKRNYEVSQMFTKLKYEPDRSRKLIRKYKK